MITTGPVQLKQTGSLLISVVRRAYHRSTGNLAEPELVTDFAQGLELVRMHKAVNRKVVLAGLQVLPQGEHINIMRSQIHHDPFNLRNGFTQPEH